MISDAVRRARSSTASKRSRLSADSASCRSSVPSITDGICVNPVRSSRKAWTATSLAALSAAGPASLAGEPGLVAFYAFDEASGQRAGGRFAGAPDLLIPREFRPLQRTVLHWPGSGDTRRGWFRQDLLLNILGFVPFLWLAGLGAPIFAYLAFRRGDRGLWLVVPVLVLVFWGAFVVAEITIGHD